jgi:hypothetical protein
LGRQGIYKPPFKEFVTDADPDSAEFTGMPVHGGDVAAEVFGDFTSREATAKAVLKDGHSQSPTITTMIMPTMRPRISGKHIKKVVI